MNSCKTTYKYSFILFPEIRSSYIWSLTMDKFVERISFRGVDRVVNNIVLCPLNMPSGVDIKV